MTIKYRGRVDCVMAPSLVDPGSGKMAPRILSDMFVNIVQHFQSASADLGIEMISANFGVVNGSQGTGFGFCDQGNPVGPRAHAVFRFHSASYGKFDCLVYMVTGSSGATFGNFVISQQTSAFAGSNFTYGGVGVSFASHPSGSNVGQSDGPWNGTYSLTSASVGQGSSGVSTNNPVWKTTSASAGAFFPRSLGIGGTYSGSRNYLATLHEDGSNVSADSQISPTRMHIILTEDSFTCLIDHAVDQSYKFTHFGPYYPRSGTVGLESPYFMITNSTQTVSPWGAFYTTTIGSTTGIGGGTATPDGSIAHPSLLSGSRNLGFVTIQNASTTLWYTNFVNGGAYERFPVWAAISEGADVAILGLVKHLSFGFGMATHTVSSLTGSAAFGTATPQSTKVLVPWVGSPPGYLSNVRTGRPMNFDV